MAAAGTVLARTTHPVRRLPRLRSAQPAPEPCWPVHQLPEAYQLDGWAGTFDVRPEDLTELDGGGSLDQDLRYGVVALSHAGADLLTCHLRRVGSGQPGARSSSVPSGPSCRASPT
ncbi:hypothetical protein I0C86_40290 [Plantactinospora sp. S1510]|uniref:Uncharacterized protein n=1 Tax=Plantactinospora alkalitolerans TaxID=2789879 RepID=A0ABS0H9L2_9ACTN|nr:hypothetical protein [Plantactinospora alkalitolerans]MBF9135120.1 hypothetical protein [Plantactinospora alkalitolerans]